MALHGSGRTLPARLWSTCPEYAPSASSKCTQQFMPAAPAAGPFSPRSRERTLKTVRRKASRVPVGRTYSPPFKGVWSFCETAKCTSELGRLAIVCGGWGWDYTLHCQTMAGQPAWGRCKGIRPAPTMTNFATVSQPHQGFRETIPLDVRPFVKETVDILGDKYR